MIGGISLLCSCLSLLGLFWGAYQSYKVLKPKVEDEDIVPIGGKEPANQNTQQQNKTYKRRRTLIRFADAYDSVAGNRMLYFWAVLSALNVYEQSPLESFVQFFIPFYYEIKFIILIALFLPNSSAPQFFFERILQPLVSTSIYFLEVRILPIVSALLRALYTRLLPTLFKRIAPLLHPSELHAWEKELRKRQILIHSIIPRNELEQVGGNKKTIYEKNRVVEKIPHTAVEAVTNTALQVAAPAVAEAGATSLQWISNFMTSAKTAVQRVTQTSDTEIAKKVSFTDKETKDVLQSLTSEDASEVGYGCARPVTHTDIDINATTTSLLRAAVEGAVSDSPLPPLVTDEDHGLFRRKKRTTVSMEHS